jgi:hypothetical protein
VAALEQQQQQLKPRLEALEAQQGTATPPAAPAAAAAATPAAAAGAAEKAAAEKPAPADAAVPAPAAQAVAAPPSGGDLGPQLQALAGKVAALEAAVQQLDTQQQQQQQQQQQGQTGQQPPVVRPAIHGSLALSAPGPARCLRSMLASVAVSCDGHTVRCHPSMPSLLLAHAHASAMVR